MKHEVYKIMASDDFNIFNFVSSGRYGNIFKQVEFVETDKENTYNLALGDLVEENKIDDYILSDNGDRNKVIATVIYIIGLYTSRFPERWIQIKANTPAKTRLYRIVVSLHLDELSSFYEIDGFRDKRITPFVRNMKIDELLIKRKQ